MDKFVVPVRIQDLFDKHSSTQNETRPNKAPLRERIIQIQVEQVIEVFLRHSNKLI